MKNRFALFPKYKSSETVLLFHIYFTNFVKLVDFFPTKKGCLKRRSQEKVSAVDQRRGSLLEVSSRGLWGRPQGEVSSGGLFQRSQGEVSGGSLNGRSQEEVSGGRLG
jgi:hypothetical protein